MGKNELRSLTVKQQATIRLQGTLAQIVKGYFTLFSPDLITQKPLKLQVSIYQQG